MRCAREGSGRLTPRHSHPIRGAAHLHPRPTARQLPRPPRAVPSICVAFQQRSAAAHGRRLRRDSVPAQTGVADRYHKLARAKGISLHRRPSQAVAGTFKRTSRKGSSAATYSPRDRSCRSGWGAGDAAPDQWYRWWWRSGHVTPTDLVFNPAGVKRASISKNMESAPRLSLSAMRSTLLRKRSLAKPHATSVKQTSCL